MPATCPIALVGKIFTNFICHLIALVFRKCITLINLLDLFKNGFCEMYSTKIATNHGPLSIRMKSCGHNNNLHSFHRGPMSESNNSIYYYGFILWMINSVDSDEAS